VSTLLISISQNR